MIFWSQRHPHIACFTVVVSMSLIWFYLCLPDPLFKTPYATVMSAENGKLLGAKIATDGQWRFPPLNTVPHKYERALILFEDKRFRQHWGVDPLATIRAFWLNLKKGRIVNGGSTLSMQVIRLMRGHKKRSYSEKLIQMIMAIRLELSYSKDEILAAYMNHAPFGGNIVGLHAASWRYFNRRARDLSWAEASLLAVLPNQPSSLHPGRNRDALLAKRDRLLERLHKKGLLDTLQTQLAKAEILPPRPLNLPMVAPHLLDTLAKKHKGKQVKTSLSFDIQTQVNNLMKNYHQTLLAKDIGNAAVLIIDNQNFKVLAYVGNSAWSNSKRGYSMDLILRPRSSGSILKPFLYASMIQQGEILPNSLVADVPTQYKSFRPHNFDKKFRGAVGADEALALSLNVPAVRMLREHGIERFYDFLKQIGVSSLFRQANDYGLTLILGGAEVTLWDVTNMYANLANIAQQIKVDHQSPYLKTRILETDITKSKRKREIQPAAAWLTLKSLLQVNRPGIDNHWRSFSSSHKISWKTGTSYGLRDAWSVGSNKHYTVGVWVGNANGEGKPEISGIKSAAPLMFQVFNFLPKKSWLPRPEWLMRKVKVCKKDGYLANGDCGSRDQWIPNESHFDSISPYHKLVHLDASGTWQVHSQCQSVANMRHEYRFILPPTMEYYYRKHHIDYQGLPPYRQDCKPQIYDKQANNPIALIYPNKGAKIYIPIDLAEQKSATVFQAIHRNSNSILFWHLNDRYLGSTQFFHDLAINIAPGKHYLTVVDQQGNRMRRQFTVLQK